MRDCAGEVAETMTRRKVDVHYIQEVRWRGASARLTTGKNSECKMDWVGNKIGLSDDLTMLVAGKWIDKIFDVKRVNDRWMIKLLICKLNVAIVLMYALQQGLTEGVKDRFYKELIILGGGFNGLAGMDANGYDRIHGGFGTIFEILEIEIILEMGSALDMIVSNMFFKKRDTRLITQTLEPSETQSDYIILRNKDRKRVRDTKVIAGEEVAQQHQLLIFDIMICAVKEVKKPFVSKRRNN